MAPETVLLSLRASVICHHTSQSLVATRRRVTRKAYRYEYPFADGQAVTRIIFLAN